MNTHLSLAPVELINARLSVLLGSVNAIYTSSNMTIEADIVYAYQSALNLFFDTLDKSITSNIVSVLPGSPPDPVQYNEMMTGFGLDMTVLFNQIGVVDKTISSSFNSIIGKREQVLNKIRRIGNRIGDLLLFADPSLGAGFFFGDSFGTADKIDVGSSLVESDECYLNTDEGVVLLPLDGSPEIPKVKSYIVNNTSNGTFGNTVDPTVVGKDRLEAIGDGEPNTWVEYEKVTAYESSVPLVLDLTIVLSAVSIINHIHINPINFGSATSVVIDRIETSRDGKEYTSIKDEVPLKDFIPEEEDNTFSLSPSTSKYAGQGFYSFLPRKVEYIHIVFKQFTPYPLIDKQGFSKLRYAIGLRDINIYGRKFKTAGSIVSEPFSSSKEIKKISLWASENPIEYSSLSDISHGISVDDGSTWLPIQPYQRNSTGTQEVLNFNNSDPTSISTEEPVESLRHKISMTRDTKAFDAPLILKNRRKEKVELLPIPSGTDLVLTTEQTFVPETVKAILPFWGSYSCPRARAGRYGIQGESFMMDLDKVEFTVDVAPIDTLRFKLPFETFDNLVHRIRVFVNGSQIEYGKKSASFFEHPDGTSYQDDAEGDNGKRIDENSKIYFLNRNGLELQFGYNLNGNQFGFIPPSGSKISVVLDGDNPQLELTDKGYVLNLSSSSDGIKENVQLCYFNNLTLAEASEYKMTLKNNKTSFPLKGDSEDKLLPPIYHGWREPEDGEGDDPIAIMSIIEYETDPLTGNDVQVYSWNPTEFIDGSDEFGGGTRPPPLCTFSFDEYSGVLYLSHGIDSTRKTIFSCKQLDAKVIKSKNWHYYKDSITKLKDFSRIVLDIDEVSTMQEAIECSIGNTKVSLLARMEKTDTVTEEEKEVPLNSKSHDWLNQKVVKGTVSIDKNIFAIGAIPVEVLFENGASEFGAVVKIDKEAITFSTPDTNYIYSFYLRSINELQKIVGSPSFSPVRSTKNLLSTVNAFTRQVSSLSNVLVVGDWYYDQSTNQVYLKGTDSTPHAHTASYSYKEVDDGVDKKGLYSIDYENAAVYFASPTADVGNISFQVSLYSAFYNIAEVIKKKDIENMDPDSKKITFTEQFGMQFMKMDTADKARPPFIKLVYEYDTQSTESIKDLEPYFSPICKEIAFRSVTADLLEEL